jgi:hypothetical protein
MANDVGATTAAITTSVGSVILRAVRFLAAPPAARFAQRRYPAYPSE